MPAKIPDNTMAKILVEAEMFGDAAVIERWEVSQRTITTYRRREASDPKFANICQEKRKLLNDAWAENAATFLNKMIGELTKRAAIMKSKEDADCFHAIAGGIKIVGDLKLDMEMYLRGKQQASGTDAKD